MAVLGASGVTGRRVVAYLAALLACLVSLVAVARYPGNRADFVLFLGAFGLLLGSAFPRPRSYGYAFLAAFLFLGFVVKATAHFAFGIALLEPTGDFNASPSAWDASLLPATVGAIGCVAARTLHLLVSHGDGSRELSEPPSRYVSSRSWVLLLTAIFVVVVNLANLAAAFYEIGLRPRLILPAHLNVVMAWLLSTGVAMWVAMMVGWDYRIAKPARGLSVALLEALASSSTLSRSSYLFRLLSYIGPLIEFRRWLFASLSRRLRIAFGIAAVVGFALSLTIVSALRTVTYPGNGATPSNQELPTATTLGGMASRIIRLPATLVDKIPALAGELEGMLIGRWIGIEGTMTVASYPKLGGSLFRESLLDDPSTGEASLYQRMAGSFYQTDAQFNFGTTPGVIAVLYYSGSSLVLFLGLCLITAVLILVELAARRLVQNSFVVSLAGLALANAISQMNFPYLFVVFLFELAGTLLVLGILVHGLPRRRTAPASITIRA